MKVTGFGLIVPLFRLRCLADMNISAGVAVIIVRGMNPLRTCLRR